MISNERALRITAQLAAGVFAAVVTLPVAGDELERWATAPPDVLPRLVVPPIGQSVRRGVGRGGDGLRPGVPQCHDCPDARIRPAGFHTGPRKRGPGQHRVVVRDSRRRRQREGHANERNEGVSGDGGRNQGRQGDVIQRTGSRRRAVRYVLLAEAGERGMPRQLRRGVSECRGITPVQALSNVLSVYFDGTPDGTNISRTAQQRVQRG